MPLMLDLPSRARVLPFAVFMLFLVVRGLLPEDAVGDAAGTWIYAAGAVAVAATLSAFSGRYTELRFAHRPTLRESLSAIVVGLVVFMLWITLDQPWMQLGTPSATFVPVGASGALQWGPIAVRWMGAALVVPIMEELFWRSYLMRWVETPRFETVDPRRIGLKAVVLSTLVFMLAHTLWLAAIVAGLAYAWLYRRTGKLWVAVMAHATTNGVLGVWVVTTRNWQFW
ncbi:MAG: protease [Rhizobacter sp.]|nr:protease [Rhizobacter sp.]